MPTQLLIQPFIKMKNEKSLLLPFPCSPSTLTCLHPTHQSPSSVAATRKASAMGALLSSLQCQGRISLMFLPGMTVKTVAVHLFPEPRGRRDGATAAEVSWRRSRQRANRSKTDTGCCLPAHPGTTALLGCAIKVQPAPSLTPVSSRSLAPKTPTKMALCARTGPEQVQGRGEGAGGKPISNLHSACCRNPTSRRWPLHADEQQMRALYRLGLCPQTGHTLTWHSHAPSPSLSHAAFYSSELSMSPREHRTLPARCQEVANIGLRAIA